MCLGTLQMFLFSIQSFIQLLLKKALAPHNEPRVKNNCKVQQVKKLW